MDSSFSSLPRRLIHFALGLEKKRAGLTEEVLSLGFGDMSFLQSKKQTDAPVLVMLHGAGADNTGWIRFARFFKNAYKLLIPDLPGHGQSVGDTGLDYGIEQQALRLKEFFDRLGVEKIHLVGSSMGAAVAIRFCSLYPQLVDSLIVIDLVGLETTPSVLQNFIESHGRNPMIVVRDINEYRRMMDFAMSSPPFLPDMFIMFLAGEKASREKLDEKIESDIEKDLDQKSIIPLIQSPTLIIWGSEDKVAHVDDAKSLQRDINDCELHIMDGIGHLPMVEKPSATAKICRSFLGRFQRN